MSLISALYTARNGLTTTQTLSEITSGNVANAMTPGYARRSAALVSPGPSQGGAIVGEIRREIDASLVRMARNESAKMMRHQVVHEGLRSYTVFLGQPGDEISPSWKFSEFHSSLTTLVNMPSSSGAQTAAVLAAQELATSIRGASDMLANTRIEVDMEIRYEVADLNQALYDLADLNLRRQDFNNGTIEAADYEDQIDAILDQVSEIVDIRTTKTADGWVSVYTTGGAALLEGDLVHDITFNPSTGDIFAGTQDITPNKSGVRGLDHGSIVGLSDLKMDIIPRFRLQLDEYARSLIVAFENSDDSLSTVDAGLFTDNGNRYDPSNLSGLAGRIQVNELLSDNSGAEVWRIRDGLGASSEGEPAFSGQIQSFLDALAEPANASPDTGIPGSVRVSDFAAEFVTAQSTVRARAESAFKTAGSAAEVINAARRNAEGVNIDEEMQQLLLIEQSYAANARVLSTVSEMMETLLAAV